MTAQVAYLVPPLELLHTTRKVGHDIRVRRESFNGATRE